MKSYVKIYGLPLMEALKALRKVAADTPEVCIMDQTISASMGLGFSPEGVGVTMDQGYFDSTDVIMEYFGGPGVVSIERCDNIISNSGEAIGEYDFYFEWFQRPSINQIEDLIIKIDNALTPINARYSITTK